MDEEAIANLNAYAARNQLELIASPGSGIHGIVFFVAGNTELGTAAIKAFFSREVYLRELSIYQRLQELGITEILGFDVPQLLGWDDELMVLKITLVSPPFVLDFAGAWLDWPPSFSEEIWEERTAKWASEFGEDWAKAQAILAELEELHIYMLDPSPANIRFR